MTTRITKTKVNLEDMLIDNKYNELTIMIKDEPTLWEWRRMSWQEKNKCVAKATLINTSPDGQATFGFDLATYYTEALKIMIGAAPFPITTTTLATMNEEIGDQLVAIIPIPLGDTGGDVAKKDSVNFSEASDQT